jgi:large subunit ribosomal protein L9
MNIIMRKHVENLGNFGDVVKVAEGYARNYLIPRGLAVVASPANIGQLNAEKEAFVRKEKLRKDKAEKYKAELDALKLSFAKKAGEDERLFGSVTSHDIEEAIKQKGFKVDKKEIILKEPIKTIGLHTVSVKLHPEVIANITIDVTKE